MEGFKKMCWYRNYLVRKGFWARKKVHCEIYIKHDLNIGGIYAIIQKDGFIKGIKIIVRKEEYFFSNFNKLDKFLTRLQHEQTDFMRILKRKLISQKLRKLEL